MNDGPVRPERHRDATLVPPAAGRRGPLVAALLAALLVTALVFAQLRVRTDMGDFVPAGDTPATRLMREEIRSGAATSLLLAGIEGATPAELARLSDSLAEGLRRSGRFAFVANGRDLVGDEELEWLFQRRYLLSPAVAAENFAETALRESLEHLLAGLRGSAAPLLERFGFADPTGAFLALALAARGGGEVRTRHGVWFAPDHASDRRPGHDRALLIARLAAGGMDLAAQDAALAAVREAFAAAKPGGARLLLSGPVVFARDSAHAIRGDVRLLSVVSTLLVAGLLVWRFRSPWVIAAISVPVLLGVSAAALAVQAAFGFVHGITLGFGMTMLGISVDYPVLLIGHRKRGEPAPATLRRIGTAFNLAVMTAALGLTGMAFSSFPGLSQLGVFAAAGVLTAAAVTRWLLPPLIVAADLAPVSAGDPARLHRLERLRAWRPAALAGLVVAVAAVMLRGGPRAETDLASLSPIPAEARALDASLRADLGVPDTGLLLVLRGPDAEAVLRREETLLPRLDVLAPQGVEAAARLLPSAATQETRRAALPGAEALAARMTTAMGDLPFRAEAFAPFLAGVEAARTLPAVRPEDVASPALRERLAPLLFARDGVWYGIVAPRSVADAARLRAAVPEDADTTWLDLRAEADQLLVRATAQAWRWLVGGAGAACLALAVALRDRRHLSRVVGPVGAALLLTCAVLALAGTGFSLLHLVALQLVAGVGLDYALFFARRQLDEEERARTLRTLVTCNVMSLLTFGLLAFCRTPLLREIGATVAVGVVSAMLFAFLFAGEARPAVKGKP